MRTHNLSEQKTLVEIPLRYLHGTQNTDDYKKEKYYRVKNGLNSQGAEYLFSNPIEVCVLELGNGLLLTIYEGHNRARQAPNYHIYSIPAFLFTVEELARKELKPTTPEQFQQNTLSNVAEVHKTFGDKMGRTGKQYPRKDLVPLQTYQELQSYMLYNPSELEQFTGIRTYQ